MCQRFTLLNGLILIVTALTRKADHENVIQRVKKLKSVSKVRFMERSIQDSYCWSVSEDQEGRFGLCCESSSLWIFQTQKAKWICLSKDIEDLSIWLPSLRIPRGQSSHFTGAAKPDIAAAFYEFFKSELSSRSPCSDRHLWSGYAGGAGKWWASYHHSCLKIDKKTKPAGLVFVGTSQKVMCLL